MLIGLVGKPNVGKSTFFKACTLSNIEISNRPFVTIAPNHGIGYIKVECVDKEFKTQCKPNHGFCIEHQRFVPVELMDVAGLIQGASEGKGLGNKFLDELRQADIFIHIVDISGETDAEGKETKDYNPVQDIEMLENELDLWYLGILKRVWTGFARTIQNTKQDFFKAVAKQFSGLKVKENVVKDVILELDYDVENPGDWNEEQLMNFAHELRHLTKPMIIASNKIDTEKAKENYEKLKNEFPNLSIMPCSADFELALREAAKKELIKYIPGEKDFEIIGEISGKQKQALDKIKKNVLDVYGGTGIQEILNYAVFDLLKYITIFPVDNANKLTDSKGNILPDCFLLPEASTALDFAYFLHTDFGNNFIRAIDAKTKRVLGKSYVLKHRDVLEIVTR